MKSRTRKKIAATRRSDGESPAPGTSSPLNRREFMRLSGGLAAAAAMTSAGCKMPREEVIPLHERPEDGTTLGKACFYATTIGGIPLLARTREARPILLTPNVAHPSPRALTVRSHAALLDLYDADRAAGPLSIRRGKGAPVVTSWRQIGEQLLSRLEEGKSTAALLTPPLHGPATKALLEQLEQHAKIRHISYAPIENEAALAAWKAAFGDEHLPRPRLDRAAVLVGFGAEFIDLPAAGLDRDFAQRRGPDAPDAMSSFLQFEGRLTLTGANADRRIRVRDSQLAAVAAAIAHEIVIGRRSGGLAEDDEVIASLKPYAPQAVAKTSGVPVAVIEGVAETLLQAPGKALAIAGGSASASATGIQLELATLLINHSLGAYDSPLFDGAMASTPAHGGAAAMAQLAEQLRTGEVSTLIVAGVNPAYDAPASLRFAEAMSKAGLVVSLNDRLDETTEHADWLAPTSHPLEAWGDDELDGGMLAIQQPVIRPLYDTYGLLDVLVTWGAALGLGGDIAKAAAATRTEPAATAAEAAKAPSAAYHYLRAYWGAHFLKKQPGTPAFEDAWSEVLRNGFWQGPARPLPKRSWLAAGAVASLGAPQPPPAMELQLYPHYALHDGRPGNNGWLLELPDPITRITWGGALSIGPRRFDEMGLSNGDLVAVAGGAFELTLPAYRHAGMHHDQVAVALGQGRPAAGLVGSDVGVNAYPLQQLEAGRVVRAGLPVTLRRASGNQPLAIMQGSEVIDRDRRPLVPVATLSQYERDPSAGTKQPPGGPSAWPVHAYDGHRWEMAIDLSKCNGCGKCTLGCQAENNIPVVGPEAIQNGREMAWLRIDRYYDSPPKEGRWNAEVWDGPLEVVEEPRTLFQPMLCQHCENAPCETVCPFNATMHSADGLNQQIYNRCVGTRYCANNCPFKVRRYNWFEYSYEQTSGLFKRLFPIIESNARRNSRGNLPLRHNPEVTVRSRGVMEKCSFCVQRIREARAEAMRQGHKDELPDGAVVPACMEACPTGAISFGDVNSPGSKVAALAKSPRAMRLLDMIGVKPAISYLTKVRNDNA